MGSVTQGRLSVQNVTPISAWAMSGVQRTMPMANDAIPKATSAWAGKSQPRLVAGEFFLDILLSSR
jgi:hypothetical protein